jgi:Xaa-Pro dipeptidase
MADKLEQLYSDHLRVVKERHDRALAEAGYDHVVIYAGEQRYMFLDDMPYPFKVNPHFKAWVPVIDNPHCFVVYTPGEKPRLVYWQPVDYWHKPAETPTGFWTSHFDIRIIAAPEDAKQHFPAGGRTAVISEHANEAGDVNPEALLHDLHFQRAWKTEYEIECMRRANALGVRGHRAAERAFRAGESEYEIHLAYLRAASSTEEELPYGNIIALNEHASVLHYYHHERGRLAEGQRHSFLIDAGAQFHGYASDITRTYSRESDEFQQLIDGMDAAQQQLVAAVRPGLNYPDLHFLAHRQVAELLARFELVRGLDADGIVEKRISSTFLPHGVGHFIGLQVHDVGGFMADKSGKTIPKPEGHPYLRLTRVVEPTMVFTIEPGFYFIEPLLGELQKSAEAKYVNWEKVDRFRKYGGIRIEDDVVVTAGGCENLTRDAFAAVA